MSDTRAGEIDWDEPCWFPQSLVETNWCSTHQMMGCTGKRPMRDKFGDLPDEWCHRGECCGPGSWCCQRAGLHYHDDVEPPQWVGAPPVADSGGKGG